LRKTRIKVISLIACFLLIAVTGTVFADRLVPATPEVQSIITGTLVNAQGTVTGTDSAVWTNTYDPGTQFFNFIGSFNPKSPQELVINSVIGNFIPASANDIANIQAQLQPLGGSMTYQHFSSALQGYGTYEYVITQLKIPAQLLNSLFPISPLHTFYGNGAPATYLDAGHVLNPNGPDNIFSSGGGLHEGALDPGQVQYTTVYNDQYSGVSGQQTFVKSMAVSTANKIADQSNIKANTNIQFIAMDTGRATRTEDLLLDGAATETDTASAILCPFAQSVSTTIPAYCNIVQAGSAFDTTLTSTVTSADTRFVGTDSTFPVALNYNINAQGITLDGQSAPMVGSASAFLKVHIQEARNASTTKSEDLVYSETSSASGLITKFSKDMHYQSGFTLI
jgi:hypothetical protein